MKRRYIILFIVILVVIIVAGILYRNRSAQQPAPAGTGLEGGGLPAAHLPAAQNGGAAPGQNGAPGGAVLLATSTQFGLVADIPVLNYFVDTNNNIFAAEPDGQIAEISNNAVTVISSSTIPYLQSASFSYDGRWLLRKYLLGQKTVFSLFDIQNKKELLVPGTIDSPAWAPDSERLMFFSDSGTVRSIATLNLSDKTPKAKVLMGLDMQDVVLTWVRPNIVLITEHPSVQFLGSVWILNISTKTVQTIASEQRAADAIWDPANPYGLLFESTNRGEGGALYLAGESSGFGLIPFSFLTLPSKCTFAVSPYLFTTRITSSTAATKKSTSTAISKASTTLTTSTAPTTPPSLTSPLYCLIPSDRNILDNSPLPDLYLQKGVYASDNAFRVDPATGETTLLYNAALPLDGTQVKVAGNRLFFVNRLDNRLYALSLP